MDSLKLKGFLKIQVRDAVTGDELSCEERPNTVCVGAKEALSRMMALGEVSAAEDKIRSIYVGDGEGVTNPADTALHGANQFRKEVEQPIQVAPDGVKGLITMVMTLEGNEFNGQTIREAGIFSYGDDDNLSLTVARMYARQAGFSITKNENISVVFTWSYQVTT